MKKYFILAFVCLSPMYLNAQKGDSKVFSESFWQLWPSNLRFLPKYQLHYQRCE